MTYRFAALLALFSLVGCATPLSESGTRVRVVTADARPSCKFVKLVTARVTLGPDKLGGALRKAMNEVGEAGGNGLFIITNTQDVFDGATVAGEALACPTS